MQEDILEEDLDDTELEEIKNAEQKPDGIPQIKSSVVLSLKSMLPKPCSGKKIFKRIKKLGFSVGDFAFLINRSAGGIYNMCCPGHARYKKGKENEDISVEIALSYLERLFEEKKQKAKEEKKQEKERVLATIAGQQVVSTTLSLRDCNTIENKAKVMEAIVKLAQAGEKISYGEVAKLTGLTPQQIANIRENNADISDWFNYTNEVEFDQMQQKLTELANENQYVKPSVAIKAIETKMKYIKSNQKDKSGDNGQSEVGNIWEKFKSMKDVTSTNNNVIIEAEVIE